MANIKSQIKRNKQNETRRLRNRYFLGKARKATREAVVTIERGDDQAGSREAVLRAVRELDKAAQKGVIHKNNAARRKSRLMKRLNSLEK